ncbi:type II toxin-antitoxin system RelE/ParE family toxin [Reichenbachiella versicolor]|uniref:type II toxin-antitoxin system RelE/ParE family toxin n=1 Tax=Reichenbachiella versicolor TaxID=1821036 RepID=UPI000D6E60DF|nr:type II toxin-antitoxin system RelE/ParE family toxin [Reichenbachiella versicolor]
MSKKVEWTNIARASLDYYCSTIEKESPSSANKVKKEIIQTSKKLAKNPYLYQLDEYYPNNNGSIRRFFRWSYRVVYQVREDKIVVLQVYHTSVNPSKDID